MSVIHPIKTHNSMQLQTILQSRLHTAFLFKRNILKRAIPIKTLMKVN